ncbi:LysR family transcriptional regulator [Fibrobacter sp. UWB13]|jgi:DNA-binding transcriptional LysR family regulator|uniref:LysR family transcriptional regulator n=1 Tax=Fibrobacter sp. UWB13 TaxID=1896204 RepID=UPI000A0E536F|nr:LysR family transcriptional regulator [Fibrobacter sp. UWB13]MBQ3778401.1 LysR family transcriptional regulator [Fibrobacter sp.]SMG30596.1 DNA-binding transcriptional regulator, LysR family [Fibrobacter sp. UWB13]
MELTQLKYFLEVARTEHVTQSAKNLCIVQPALTQAIHKLEDELGVSLFKNSGRNIKLTDSGKFFYEKLQPLYENMMALPALLKEMSDKQNNNVKLNVLAASTLITSAVIEYKRSNSDIDVDIVQNEETSVFDICVRTYANYRPELDNTESDETFVHSEKIYLAVPNTAQYKKLDSISLFDLKDEKFIRLYGSKQYRQICNELCDSIGFHTNVTFESDNAAVVKEAVAAGIGVGFWPELSWGKMDHKRVRLLEITDTDFKRDIVVSLRRNKQDNSKTEQFYNFLTKYILQRQSKKRK